MPKRKPSEEHVDEPLREIPFQEKVSKENDYDIYAQKLARLSDEILLKVDDLKAVWNAPRRPEIIKEINALEDERSEVMGHLTVLEKNH